jgi:hypothetical protein
LKKIIVTLLIILLCIANVSLATENTTIEKEETIPVANSEEFVQQIPGIINDGKSEYKLLDVGTKENYKTVTKEKTVQDKLIVTTNDKYKVLQMFNTTKSYIEDDYVGVLNVDINSLAIKINDRYTEEYKVYLQKDYINLDSNEINYIEKEIVQDGTTYYLINPAWEIAKTEDIEGGTIHVKYNGMMYYEGIKTRTIIKDYVATINYLGNLEKQEVESVTYIMKYEKIEQDTNYIVPIAIAGGSIFFCSGIILFRKKKAKKVHKK